MAGEEQQQREPRYCKGCALGVRLGDYCEGCLGLAMKGKDLLESDGYPDYFTGDVDQFGKPVLRREMVDQWANEIALTLALSSIPKKLNKHQLRQFFNEIKLIRKAVRTDSDYARMNARVGMVAGHANARYGRESIPALFRVFVCKNVAKVQDMSTLVAFAAHFEAVVAFCEGRIEKEGR